MTPDPCEASHEKKQYAETLMLLALKAVVEEYTLA
jgi:hypothetical protein